MLLLLLIFHFLFTRSTSFISYLGDSVDENMLEELDDSSQRHSSVGEKLTTLTVKNVVSNGVVSHLMSGKK